MKKLLYAFVLCAGLGSCITSYAAQCQPESVCIMGQGCQIVTVCR